jgi:hypothetical protein
MRGASPDLLIYWDRRSCFVWMRARNVLTLLHALAQNNFAENEGFFPTINTRFLAFSGPAFIERNRHFSVVSFTIVDPATYDYLTL